MYNNNGHGRFHPRGKEICKTRDISEGERSKRAIRVREAESRKGVIKNVPVEW